MTETDMKKEKRMELLAPAGTLDICKAVINAGADAVYLGGRMFGARAFAGNLSGDEISEALDYAHLRGAKIYLTLNTLLEEKELKKAYDLLKPLYLSGSGSTCQYPDGCHGKRFCFLSEKIRCKKDCSSQRIHPGRGKNHKRVQWS